MIRAIEWPHQGKAACVPPFFYYVELVAILNRTIPLMPGQLNIQVTSDVDLDKLGEPRVFRHPSEALDQPVLDGVGEVSDAPFTQRARVIAANRVLDVKQRLSRAAANKVAVPIGMFRRTDERNLLLLEVEANPFQDQAIRHRREPKALPRRPHEGFGSIGL